MTNFTHLHVHTKFSLLDSILEVDKLIERLKELGQTSVALTDHGNMYGVVENYKKLKEADIKLIIGCEVYVCDDVTVKNKDSITSHLILLCKNETGRVNLNRLVSESTKYKYRGKPRVDVNMIKKYSDGLICLSACMAGELSRSIMNDDMVKAQQIIDTYKEIFKDDYYLEYQSHNEREQLVLNNKIVSLAIKNNIKYVVTCDAHYVNKEEQNTHSLFTKIGTTREVGETYRDCYLQDVDTIKDICTTTRQYNDIAIQTTQEIVDKCNAKVPLSAPVIPTVKVPPPFTSKMEYLHHLIKQGWYSKRINEMSNSEKQVYKDRLEYELDSIGKMGFEGYYLLVHSYVSSVKRRGIARGSAGGSLVAYLCGIVDINPITNNLYFERFIDVGAIELYSQGKIKLSDVKIPDVDTDFGQYDRKKVVQFIIETYGEQNVVSLGTFQYIWAKGAIKDLGKALDIPFSITNEMTKNLNNESITEALELGLLDKYRREYPVLFEQATKLAGLPKSFGRHACAKVISMKESVYYNAIEYNEDDNTWTLQGDMHTADDVGLVKIDALGLRTLDTIYDTLDLIGKDYEYIAPHNIDFNDELVWKEFSNGNTDGIFQFSSNGMKKMLKDMQCNSIENLSASNALFRPGSIKYIENYINRKNGVEPITYLHSDLKPILENTYGIIVFQEQLIEIGKFAGLKNPDMLRKATAKKIPELMEVIEPELKNGLMAKGWEESQVDKLWLDILEFSRYSFNKCVSGSTKLKRLNGEKDLTISEMFLIKNDIEYAKSTNNINLHTQYNNQGYGNSYSMGTNGVVVKNKIVDIYFSGIKQTFKVTTQSGATVVCTSNHKMPTKNGLIKLSNLKVGDLLYTTDLSNKVFDDKIISIEKYDVEPVYDVEMANPNHTFVTESGLIVSNSHSSAYAIIAYITMYLKVHHPYEFVSSWINSYNGDANEICNCVKEARRMKLNISFGKWNDLSPTTCVNVVDGKKVLKLGTNSIKFCSQDVATELKNKHFDNFFDLLKYVYTQSCINMKQLSILIKLDFFEEYGSSNLLLFLMKSFDLFKQGNVKQISKSKINDEVLLSIVKAHSRETKCNYVDLQTNKILDEYYKHFVETDSCQTSVKNKILWQQEFLGYISFRTEMECDRFKLLILDVKPLKTKDKTKVWAYSIETLSFGKGSVAEVLIWKRAYDKKPLIKYDVIKTNRNCFSRNVYNGKTSWYLTDYDVLQQ